MRVTSEFAAMAGADGGGGATVIPITALLLRDLQTRRLLVGMDGPGVHVERRATKRAMRHYTFLAPPEPVVKQRCVPKARFAPRAVA